MLCYILIDAVTVHRLPKPLRIICCVPALLAFAVIIATMAIVAVKCVQDMPAVSNCSAHLM